MQYPGTLHYHLQWKAAKEACDRSIPKEHVTCLQALIDSTEAEGSLDNETAVRAVALFDHEEVGSSSAVGAGGTLMRDAIIRVSSALADGRVDATERCLQNSFLVSADMAHGLHPNYADRHEPDHQPKFHQYVSNRFYRIFCMESCAVSICCVELL